MNDLKVWTLHNEAGGKECGYVHSGPAIERNDMDEFPYIEVVDKEDYDNLKEILRDVVDAYVDASENDDAACLVQWRRDALDKAYKLLNKGKINE